MAVSSAEEAWREAASVAAPGAPPSLLARWWETLSAKKNIHAQIATYRSFVEPELPPDTRVHFLLALFFREAEGGHTSTSDAATATATALPEPEDGVGNFRQFCTEARIDDEKLMKTTIEILNRAKEGETIPSDDPVAYFRDLELANLGQSPEEYEKHVEEVKEEYRQSTPEQYRATRLKVLQMLLSIPRIYISDAFNDRFEAVARENIRKEIDMLSSPE